jgi:dihydrofolate reductase
MINAIFAVDCWGGMGHNGSLPWPHHKEDLQYFKEKTNGHIVIMGRNTWDDPKMPKPLPNRITYVVTNRPIIGYNVKCIAGDLKEKIVSLQKQYAQKTIWVIGGPKILMDLRNIFDEAYITHFKAQYRTDVQIDLKKFLQLFRITSAKPSVDKDCNWSIYKNIDIFKN